MRIKFTLALFGAAAVTTMAQSTPAQQKSSMLDQATFKIQPIKSVQLKSRASSVNAWYMPPLIRLFQGFDKVREYYGDTPMEVYPPNEYLEWYNLSENGDNVQYTWSYFDIDTQKMAEINSEDFSYYFPLDKLNINPQFEGIGVNGLLLPNVTLKATTADGEACYESSRLIQIGGAGIVDATSTTGIETTVINGLLPFGVESDGLMTYTQGDNVPVFGYSPESDQWLTDMIFRGEPEEDDYAYCDAIFNTVIAAETPLTVRGARFFGRGKLNDDAVLTFLIYTTTEEGEFITTPIAEVSCPVSQMIVTEDGDENIYEVPFTLNSEVKLSASESPYYLVGITGFHEAAEWFAPYQSEKPNEYELALGYYRCTVKYDGNWDDWYMWHVANFTNADGQDLYSTFAICLDAAYPWVRDPWYTSSPAIAAPAPAPADGKAYDLQGRPVREDYRGIVVRDGKITVARAPRSMN